MQQVRPSRRERWPGKAAGDKGYSYPRVRRWLARRGIDAVIPDLTPLLSPQFTQ